jgi:hypothetical protein
MKITVQSQFGKKATPYLKKLPNKLKKRASEWLNWYSDCVTSMA